MKENNKVEKGSRKLMLSSFLLIFAMISLYVFSNNTKETYSASEACLNNLSIAQPGAYCGYVTEGYSSLPACTEVLVDSCNSSGNCTSYTTGGQMYVIPKANLSKENPCAGGNNVQNTTNSNPETGTTASYILFILAILAGGYSIYYYNRTSKVN
ncbi:MAG: hypothetical protein IJZ79_06690 [Bacilli bacterium]|nr:hypothetical protein [Bacilli bacterium]